MRMEAKKDLTQSKSLVTAVIARYSASVEEWDMVVYFFVLHEMGELPNVTK